MPQPTMPSLELEVDHQVRSSLLLKGQPRVSLESIDAKDQMRNTKKAKIGEDTADAKDLEMLNGENVVKVSTHDTDRENDKGEDINGGRDESTTEGKTINSDTEEQAYPHVLYPGGGDFNKLRKKQAFLDSLVHNCVDGYVTEGPDGKRKFVKEHILDQIPGGLHIYRKETGQIYKPDENDAFARVSQRIRDIKKNRLRATKAEIGRNGGLKNPGGRGSKCDVWAGEILLLSFLFVLLELFPSFNPVFLTCRLIRQRSALETPSC